MKALFPPIREDLAGRVVYLDNSCLPVKLQLVYAFVNCFSFCSDGDTNPVQVGSLDTTNCFAVCRFVGGRKHLSMSLRTL